MSIVLKTFYFFRLCGLWIYIVLQTILWSVISIILFLFEPKGRLAHEYGARTWAKILLSGSGVKVSLVGKENINRLKGSGILIVNHQSLFDVLALLGYLPMDFKFVVKKELMKVPLWGFAMKRAGYMPIARGNSKDAQRLFKDAAQRIKNGSWVLFFAEGTRSSDGRLQKFKGGAFRLAKEAECEILPVVVQGSKEVLPKKSLAIKPGHVVLTVLNPISANQPDLDSWKLMQEVRNKMLAFMEKNQELKKTQESV